MSFRCEGLFRNPGLVCRSWHLFILGFRMGFEVHWNSVLGVRAGSLALRWLRLQASRQHEQWLAVVQDAVTRRPVYSGCDFAHDEVYKHLLVASGPGQWKWVPHSGSWWLLVQGLHILALQDAAARDRTFAESSLLRRPPFEIDCGVDGELRL